MAHEYISQSVDGLIIYCFEVSIYFYPKVCDCFACLLFSVIHIAMDLLSLSSILKNIYWLAKSINDWQRNLDIVIIANGLKFVINEECLKVSNSTMVKDYVLKMIGYLSEIEVLVVEVHGETQVDKVLQSLAPKVWVISTKLCYNQERLYIVGIAKITLKC